MGRRAHCCRLRKCLVRCYRAHTYQFRGCRARSHRLRGYPAPQFQPRGIRPCRSRSGDEVTFQVRHGLESADMRQEPTQLIWMRCINDLWRSQVNSKAFGERAKRAGSLLCAIWGQFCIKACLAQVGYFFGIAVRMGAYRLRSFCPQVQKIFVRRKCQILYNTRPKK
jgi:hypothetical protein